MRHPRPGNNITNHKGKELQAGKKISNIFSPLIKKAATKMQQPLIPSVRYLKSVHEHGYFHGKDVINGLITYVIEK